MLNTPAKFYIIRFARTRARELQKLDFPPILNILIYWPLLHMIDFMSHHALILCMHN